MGSPAARRADPVAWLIACAVAAAYTVISVFRYAQLDPASWDLGIFTESVKQYARLHAPVADIRGAGFNLFGDHFSPIVALIAPFFRIAPSPITLLAAQALLAGVSVLAVSRAGTQMLGAGTGRAIGAAYGFSWGLQQMIDVGFHEIAFAVPLLAFSGSALVRGRTRAAVAWALPLVFVKEDQGLTAAAIGLVMIATSRRNAVPGQPADAGAAPRRPAPGAAVRGGLLLTAWGLGWSLLAITVIIPHFSPAHHYQYWSDGGVMRPGGGFSPDAIIGQFLVAWPVKLRTALLILAPAAFIAVRSPFVLAAVPSVALRFLSVNSYFWGTAWHYNATVMPIVFIAAIDAMAQARRARAAQPPPYRLVAGRPLMAAAERFGAPVMLAIAAALAFHFPLSDLWHAQTYRTSAHDADARAAMAAVPDGAAVTTTLDLLAPLAARTDTFWIGNAGNPSTRYIVFDGANSGYSQPPASVPVFVARQHPGVRYTEIYDSGDVYVFRRDG